MIYKSTSTPTRMSTGIFRINNVIISLVLCLILLISPSRAFQRTIFKKLRSESNLLSRADERRAFAPAFSPPLLSFPTKKSLLDVVPRGGDQDQELNGDNHEAEAEPTEDEDEYEYEQESSEDEEELPDDELILSSSYTSTSTVESQLQSLDDADTRSSTDTDTATTDTATDTTAAAPAPSKSESKQSESSLAIWGSVSSAFQMNIDAKDELIHNNTNTITTNNANEYEYEYDYANTVAVPDTDTFSDTDSAPDNENENDDKFENAHDEYDDNEELLIEEEYDNQDCTDTRTVQFDWKDRQDIMQEMEINEYDASEESEEESSNSNLYENDDDDDDDEEEQQEKIEEEMEESYHTSTSTSTNTYIRSENDSCLEETSFDNEDIKQSVTSSISDEDADADADDKIPSIDPSESAPSSENVAIYTEVDSSSDSETLPENNTNRIQIQNNQEEDESSSDLESDLEAGQGDISTDSKEDMDIDMDLDQDMDEFISGDDRPPTMEEIVREEWSMIPETEGEDEGEENELKRVEDDDMRAKKQIQTQQEKEKEKEKKHKDKQKKKKHNDKERKKEREDKDKNKKKKKDKKKKERERKREEKERSDHEAKISPPTEALIDPSALEADAAGNAISGQVVPVQANQLHVVPEKGIDSPYISSGFVSMLLLCSFLIYCASIVFRVSECSYHVPYYSSGQPSTKYHPLDFRPRTKA